LPDVVEVKDIKGELHAHSTYSDGVASVEEMATSAAALGYEYFAITDHGSGRWQMGANVGRQSEEVSAINRVLDGKMTLLHGVEMSIRADGGFGFSNEVLEGFDLVIASVHDAMGQDPSTMTRRIIRAIEHPKVNIIGHPTGRRIGTRPPIEFDLEAVFGAAARNNVALEISGHPERIDLRDEHVRIARRFGCKFAINTDSHRPEALGRMRLGVATAQRGWAGKDEVINAWPLAELRRFLSKQV
jgi:DNA polymerase (family 10)